MSAGGKCNLNVALYQQRSGTGSEDSSDRLYVLYQTPYVAPEQLQGMQQLSRLGTSARLPTTALLQHASLHGFCECKRGYPSVYARRLAKNADNGSALVLQPRRQQQTV